MRLAVVAASALLATILAGCAATAGPVDMPMPEWSSGYAWTFAFDRSWEEVWYEDGERGNESDSRQGRYVVEVLNTSLSADGEPLYLMGVQEAGGGPAVQIVRQRDLSRLAFGWSLSSQCTNGACMDTFGLRNVRTDAPTFLDFPLQNGKRWGGPIGDDGPRIVYEASVDGAARVDTPLGLITAARIVIHAGPDDVRQFEQKIRQDAQAAGYRIDHLRIGFSERQVVYYSHEYQTIVLHQRESTESFQVRGTDPDGEAFDLRGDEKERYRAVIEGARLVARPERSMADVGRFLTGQLPLRDPTGQVVADVGYTLRIDPPHATVNAASTEAANFTVVVDGDLPEDVQLRWSMVPREGQAVATGQGPSFTAAPSRPGTYSVEVESVRDGQVVAAAGASLVADWERIVTLECGALGVPGCPRQPLPVHPGAQSLFVRGTPQGPLPDIGDAMRVYDRAGTAIAATRQGDDFIVAMDSLAGHLVDHEPWTLEFRQGLAVASPVEVEVVILYGAGDVPDRGQAASMPAWPLPWA